MEIFRLNQFSAKGNIGRGLCHTWSDNEHSNVIKIFEQLRLTPSGSASMYSSSPIFARHRIAFPKAVIKKKCRKGHYIYTGQTA